jgi:hypothetical protein
MEFRAQVLAEINASLNYQLAPFCPGRIIIEADKFKLGYMV